MIRRGFVLLAFIATIFPACLLAQANQRYKIGLIDLMLLKRQKLGAITLASELKADGVEVDMGVSVTDSHSIINC